MEHKIEIFLSKKLKILAKRLNARLRGLASVNKSLINKDNNSQTPIQPKTSIPPNTGDILASEILIDDFTLPIEFYLEAFGIGSKNGMEKLGLSWDGVVDKNALKILKNRQSFLASTASKTRMDEIRNIVGKGIKNGDIYTKIGQQINDYLGVDKNAKDNYLGTRIARTESQYAINEGKRQQLMSLNYEYGDVDVALTACPTCVAIADGNPYKLSEIEGMLPIHNFCRCSLEVHHKFKNA